MITEFSLAKNGDEKVSRNFTVREFRCHDGSDRILIDTDMVAKLQQIRDYFGRPVLIGSGYRTLAYNARIGGADGSHHTTGKAVDFDVGIGKAAISPMLVAMYADAIGCGGVGRYIRTDGQSWVHIDVGRYNGFWYQTKPGKNLPIATFLPEKRKQLLPLYSYEVSVLQHILAAHGYKVSEDGKFGKQTHIAVLAFQRDNRLQIDGVVGTKTWGALFAKMTPW